MFKIMGDEELDRTVLFYLNYHKGESNPIERWTLVEKLFGAAAVIDRSNNNHYDRAMRESVERLRDAGQHICNMGAGYFMAETVKEYENFKARYLGSAFSKFQKVAAMDRKAVERWGRVPKTLENQPTLFGG